MQSKFKRRLKRVGLVLLVLVFLLLFVAFPVAASFLITNSRFRFPERGPKTPEAVGLTVQNVEFMSSDGVPLKGWWSPGEPTKPAIVFVHGLNRSRLELLDRAAEANHRGYGVLLFDLRNHGESGKAFTSLGILERRDVCAAEEFLEHTIPGRAHDLWGVSLGASSALLAARQCPRFSAAISDSSFLSFRETIAHHLGLYFHLPAFPISNLIVGVTGWRLGVNPDEGDVEAAVQTLKMPILFIAGGNDQRMPPALAQRLLAASHNPASHLVVVPGAKHGEAISADRALYLKSVFEFLDAASPSAEPAH